MAEDIEVYNIAYEKKGKSLRQRRMTYRKTYAIRRKRAKVCPSANRKGYQSAGSLWDLVVEENHSDYLSSMFSIV